MQADLFAADPTAPTTHPASCQFGECDGEDVALFAITPQHQIHLCGQHRIAAREQVIAQRERARKHREDVKKAADAKKAAIMAAAGPKRLRE